jgi:hypothetical protein
MWWEAKEQKPALYRTRVSLVAYLQNDFVLKHEYNGNG